MIQNQPVYSSERITRLSDGNTTSLPLASIPPFDASTGENFAEFSSTTGLIPRLHITVTDPRSITSQRLLSSKRAFTCPGRPSFKEVDVRRNRIKLRYQVNISSWHPWCTSSQFSFDRKKVSTFSGSGI